MLSAMKGFMKGMRSMHMGWQIWLLLLGMVNMMIPLIFIQTIEARVVLVTFIVAFSIGVALFRIQGFTRLLGLMHFVWFPMLYFIRQRLGMYPVSELFGLWLRSLIILNCISLAIDVTDVIRYISGDREPAV